MAKRRFWSCENLCPCDDYVELPSDSPHVEWISMTAGGSGPYLWCPHCEAPCTEVLEYEVPPAPYDVDGDGWVFRPLLPDEDAAALEDAVGCGGFVSADGARLYLHGVECEP